MSLIQVLCIACFLATSWLLPVTFARAEPDEQASSLETFKKLPIIELFVPKRLTAEKVVTAVNAKWGHVTRIQADMTVGAGANKEAKGVVQREGKLFRVELTVLPGSTAEEMRPAGAAGQGLSVYDGTALWLRPSLETNRVTRLDLSQPDGAVAAPGLLVALFTRSPVALPRLSSYILREEKHGEDVYYRLDTGEVDKFLQAGVPPGMKVPESAVRNRRIAVILSKATLFPERVELYVPQKTPLHVEYKNVLINRDFPPEVFTFPVAEYMQVVDGMNVTVR